MDGIIILKKADFSVNNIGVKTILDTYTKKILGIQTKYSENSNEAIALNTFIRQLTDNGYIGDNDSLLKVLMLPCLAKTNEELFYNIANIDTDGYPTNWTPNDPSPYVLTDKGVYANDILLSGTSTGKGFSTNNLFEANKPASFSIINYLYDSITALTVMRPISACNYGLNITLAGRSASVGIAEDISSISDVREDVPKGFYAMSYENNNIIVNLNGETDGTITYKEVPAPSKVDALNNNFILLQGYSYDSGVRPYSSLIACGKPMTAEQLDLLKQYTDRFMSALNI